MYIVGAQEAQITKIAKTVILIQGYEREPLQACVLYMKKQTCKCL